MRVEEELVNYQKFKVIEKKEFIISKIINWTLRNLKFICIPGNKIQELKNRELEYQKKRTKRRFINQLKSKLTVLSLIIIFIVLTLVIFGFWISPYTIEEATGYSNGEWASPSPAHPLGQTYQGRDVLARIIFGARYSLTIAIASVSISIIIGIITGLVAAYYGKWLDMVLMRIMDIILAFPGVVLAIAILAILGPRHLIPIEQSFRDIILIFGLINVPYFSRLTRGSVILARELPYVSAAKVVGANNSRIMFKHILPNCIQPIVVSFSFKIGSVILSLTVLSFLDFGDPRMIDWGSDIFTGSIRLIQAPWASIWPSIAVLLTVLGFMLLGDGLRDAFDPYFKKKINKSKTKIVR